MSLSIFARGYIFSLLIYFTILLYLNSFILLLDSLQKNVVYLSKFGEKNNRIYNTINTEMTPLEIKGKFKQLALFNLPKGKNPSNGVIITGRLMPPGNKIDIKMLKIGK